MENYKERLENAIKNLEKCNEIIDVNKKHIIDFLNRLYADNLSLRRQLKYIYTLKPILIELIVKDSPYKDSK